MSHWSESSEAVVSVSNTNEDVRNDKTSSLPDSRETTQTVLISFGSTATRISDSLRSSAPSGASGISIGAA